MREHVCAPYLPCACAAWACLRRFRCRLRRRQLACALLQCTARRVALPPLLETAHLGLKDLVLSVACGSLHMAAAAVAVAAAAIAAALVVAVITAASVTAIVALLVAPVVGAIVTLSVKVYIGLQGMPEYPLDNRAVLHIARISALANEGNPSIPLTQAG
eukprot:2065077-Pleurochrysis_carterae.AAC.2